MMVKEGVHWIGCAMIEGQMGENGKGRVWRKGYYEEGKRGSGRWEE